MKSEIRIQATPLDPLAESAWVYADDPSVGGAVNFIGLMRDMNQGEQVSEMFLEHYPGMTESALTQIVDEAATRWELNAVKVIHRVGRVAPCDPIVLVAVASAHRGEAFRACEFIIDYLKTRAPFWKREQTQSGKARWVDARDSDDQAAAVWSSQGERTS